MAKKRINIKGYLVFIIIAGAIAYSYFYSKEVYTCYLRTFYERIRGQSIEQQLQKAEEMYASHEYEKLMKFVKDLIIIYPENRDLKKLDGLALIKLGEPKKGTELILSATNGGPMPEKLLEETAGALFEQKMYRDIIIIFKQNKPGRNPNLLYWYGVALLETGVTGRAIEYLKQAIGEGRTDYEAYLYTGKALEKTGNTRASLPYLEHARHMNGDDTDTGLSLANAYRKLGRLDDAAKIMRSLKQR